MSANVRYREIVSSRHHMLLDDVFAYSSVYKVSPVLKCYYFCLNAGGYIVCCSVSVCVCICVPVCV